MTAGADPYGTHRAAATLALARQWNIPVRTASEILDSWARSLDVRVAEIAHTVLDEVYGYWRRHGPPDTPPPV